jgi:hypothetical protein
MKERVHRILVNHNIREGEAEDEVSLRGVEPLADSARLETLLAQNKSLQMELCALRTECLHAETKYKSKYERMRKDFVVEEQKRRIEWEVHKTVEIKEQTIHQLAPEIEKILYQHKVEKEMWARLLEDRGLEQREG